MEANRRATRRFPLSVQAEIQKIGSQSIHLTGTTRDFSTAGAFIYLNRPIAEGSSIVFVLELSAEITLSESTQVVCEGRSHSIRALPRPSGVALRCKLIIFSSLTVCSLEGSDSAHVSRRIRRPLSRKPVRSCPQAHRKRQARRRSPFEHAPTPAKVRGLLFGSGWSSRGATESAITPERPAKQVQGRSKGHKDCRFRNRSGRD